MPTIFTKILSGEIPAHKILADNKIKSKANLPLIKYHEDMIARILALTPGDIVKITRPSPSAGEYISYRVCVP